MKLFRKFMALSLITVAVLYGIFFYINKYLLNTDNLKFQSKKVEITNVSKNVQVNIPAFAENIKVSYDGAYVAYETNKVLNMTDTRTGLNKEMNLNNEVSFYNWLPDRNRILLVEDLKVNNSKVFRLDYYDVDREEMGNISEFNAFDSTAQIKDLRVSTITNSIYMKAENHKGRAKIYYLNIMKKLKKIKTKVNHIGNIAVVTNKSSMAYEDRMNGRIFVTNRKNPLVIDNVLIQSLLGMDNQDNVYIGETVGNKIVKIYSESLDASTIKWYPYELRAPVDKSDIYISNVGNIYINDALKNALFSVKSDEYINYPGELLQIIDNDIISINHGMLVMTKLKG
jgi:hypothetical protein